MARMKLVFLSALSLLLLGTVCCLTNLEVYNLLKDHATDLVIITNLNNTCERHATDLDTRVDETLCDDVINVPGGPNDEFDEDYFLKKLGFVPYKSDDECEIKGKPDEGNVDETQKDVDKYCHYRQYRIHGPQDVVSDLQCHHHHHHGHHHHNYHHHHCHHHGHHHHGHHHHHHHHGHHHHHHCHHHDYVKCSCQRRECSCCLRHTFRFNHCSHSTKFTLKACVAIEYKGKEPCPTTTTAKAATTTTKQATTTTTPCPCHTTTTQAATTTTSCPCHTTTTQAATTTSPCPCHTTTTEVAPPPNEECPYCERDIYDVTFTVNEQKVLEHHVTLDHLQPLCYNLSLGKGTAKVCINFYNVDKSRKRVCTRLTGIWTIGNEETQIHMNIGCMTLSFSQNTGLMDILTNEKFWREMIIDQKFDEE